MMVGRLFSFWDGKFSGAMLNFGRVLAYCLHSLRYQSLCDWSHWKTCQIRRSRTNPPISPSLQTEHSATKRPKNVFHSRKLTWQWKKKNMFNRKHTHTHTHTHLLLHGGMFQLPAILVSPGKYSISHPYGCWTKNLGGFNPQIIPFVHRVWTHEINQTIHFGWSKPPIFGSTSSIFGAIWWFCWDPFLGYPTSVATSRLSAFLSGCHLRQLNLGWNGEKKKNGLFPNKKNNNLQPGL